MKEYLNIAIDAAIMAGRKTLEFYHKEVDVFTKDDNSPLTLADLESNKIINTALKNSGFPLLSEENAEIPFAERKKWNSYWLIDPLDGTKEFIKKSSEYTINIALITRGKPVLGVVYAPVLDQLYFASRNLGSFKVLLQGESTVQRLIKRAEQLPVKNVKQKVRIVASVSHLSAETKKLIDKLEKYTGSCEIRPYGSSIKLCMVAQGVADIYPRLGSTMEWDTAAGHAVAEIAGCKVLQYPGMVPLAYNKENLLNPHFIVYSKEMEDVILSAAKEV